MTPGKLISNPQLAKSTGLSRTLLYRLRQRGELPYLQVAGRIYYLIEDVEAWLARHRRVGVEQ